MCMTLSSSGGALSPTPRLVGGVCVFFLTNDEANVDDRVESQPPPGVDGRKGHPVRTQHRYQDADHGDAGVPLELVPLVRQHDQAVV